MVESRSFELVPRTYFDFDSRRRMMDHCFCWDQIAAVVVLVCSDCSSCLMVFDLNHRNLALIVVGDSLKKRIPQNSVGIMVEKNCCLLGMSFVR